MKAGRLFAFRAWSIRFAPIVPASQTTPVAVHRPAPLQAFRGEARAGLPLHPLERLLVVLASIQLCFLPWAFGGVVLWAQMTALVLSVAAIVVAVQRRIYDEPYVRTERFMLYPLHKLWRFPVFWLGLLFLGYILIQALNPSHVRTHDQTGWWMEPVKHIMWLPTSMSASFAHNNPWRSLITFGASWLLVCALWIGLTRRSAVINLLSVVVINGTLLALVAILQKVTNAREVLWFYKVRFSYFVGTIIYKNQAGAFFYLLLALCAALVWWHAQRSFRQMKKTSPAPVYGFCAVILGMTVLLSYSKGAILLMLGYLTIGGLGFLAWSIFGSHHSINRRKTIIIAVALAGFVAISGNFLRIDQPIARVQAMLEKGDEDHSVKSRQTAAAATWDMARANIWTGWGAGSFEHYFPVFQQHYPTLGSRYKRPLLWRYAHNDYLQSLSAFGVIGLCFPAAIFLWWAYQLAKVQVFKRPALLLALGGLLMLMVHSWIDFQMHNPAVFTTWCVGWVLITRWAETEPV